jgi:hypothetical protein
VLIANFDFDHKTIIINNVKNRAIVEKHCEIKVKEGIIDAFYCVEDYAETVLDFFEIDLVSFKGGYVYSIAELLGIYLCKTEFLLHFSSDSLLKKNNSNWIKKGIKIIKNNPNIVLANPTWNYKFAEAKSEATSELEDFYVGSGFSDQCYLIKTAEFKNPIYNEKNSISERYPSYGGELFEKRVYSHIMNNDLTTITNKHITYMHPNYF